MAEGKTRRHCRGVTLAQSSAVRELRDFSFSEADLSFWSRAATWRAKSADV